MSKKGGVIILFLSLLLSGFSQESPKKETYLAGVYQGKTLFIQNPYDRSDKRFCIEEVLINEKKLEINYRMSAIKIDFDGYDLFTPVRIKLIQKDTLCSPIIINPEAVLFHTIFRFVNISLTDSAFAWSTKGERGTGEFQVERLRDGIWVNQETIEGSGTYEGAEYVHFPNLEEGANKYRVRYNFPSGSRTNHLYSREVDFDHYPEPVEFTPKSAKTRLYLSRSSHFEIYDDGQTLVLEGQGKEIDVRVLRKGRYVIYFNGKDPGTFIKE